MDRRKTQSESAPIALEVLDQITERMDAFTPRQRAFAEYVLQNPENLAFLSITDLAKEAGVSQATIVRFCNGLGYDGYAHLAREAQQAIQTELSTAGRFRLVRRMGREDITDHGTSAFERIIGHEIENLINLSKGIKSADFYRCVEMMAEADRICIIGCMASSSLAIFFGYMLSKIFPHVDVLHSRALMTSAVCQRLTEKSLAFLISFPRYPRETVGLGRLAAERGARLVAITNSHISPVVPLATLSFFLPVSIPSFVDAYAAPIVFINALITELSERDPERTQQALGEFDQYASGMDLFLIPRQRRSPR
jgi:DNA-binding MurR/RpiR family transcriptional regulator